MAESTQYDVVVIGSGPGGCIARIRTEADAGQRVLVPGTKSL